jgi:hypothetical protein
MMMMMMKEEEAQDRCEAENDSVFATTEISDDECWNPVRKKKEKKRSKVYYVTDTQSEPRSGSKHIRQTTLFQKKVPFA